MQKQNIKTMRQISKLLGFVCLLSLAACGSERVYTTASYASLKSYTAKQHYIDTKTTKTYVQGDISFGKHMQEAGDFDDTKTIASINAHRTTTGNFYNFYYGLGASFGNYKFKEGFDSLIDDGEKQSFYNINLKTGANITYTRPKIDYRFLGLELTYHNEFGPYQDKLTELAYADNENLIIVNHKSMFSYHFYSEYAFKISHEEAITLGFYFGGLFKSEETKLYKNRNEFSGFTFGLRLKQCTFSLLHESGYNDIRSTKFGITYQL